MISNTFSLLCKVFMKLSSVSSALEFISHNFKLNLIDGVPQRKPIPMQACTGPEDSINLRLPGFKAIGT